MRWGSILAGGVLALAAAPALAENLTQNDVRCAIIAFNMAGSDNPNFRTQGVMGSLYYLGKLDGRTPGLDLEARVRAEVTKMTPEQSKIEGQRCAAELGQRSKALQEMGARLAASVKPQ